MEAPTGQLEGEITTQHTETITADAGHESPSVETILWNVGAQLLNIALFLFVFVKYFGGKIKQQLLERKDDLAKIESSKQTYATMMSHAQTDVDALIAEGKAHKEQLVQEGKLLGKQHEEKILADAQKKAADIVDESTRKVAQLEQQLKDGFVDGVKQTTKLVINKLIPNHPDMKQAYVDELVREFTDR